MTTLDIKILKKFENGIRFSCQMCGACCSGEEAGEVYLFEDDIKRLANYLNYKGSKGLKEFCRKYLIIVKDTFYWKKLGSERGKTYKYDSLGFKFTGDDEHCEFLSDNKCTIHEARPFQCSDQIEYWDETDGEIIFKCLKCGKIMPIPFDRSQLHFYLA